MVEDVTFTLKLLTVNLHIYVIFMYTGPTHPNRHEVKSLQRSALRNAGGYWGGYISVGI